MCLKNSTDNALKRKNNEGKSKMKNKKNKANNKSKLDGETEIHISSISNIDKEKNGEAEKKKAGNTKIKHHNSITTKVS
jgi:parvulin-like peptidyl-prolyl isomerase